MVIVRSLFELEEVLREKLRDRDLSFGGLERETEIARSRLSDFKNYKLDFPLSKLNRLAKYFGVKFRLENWDPKEDEIRVRKKAVKKVELQKKGLVP